MTHTSNMTIMENLRECIDSIGFELIEKTFEPKTMHIVNTELSSVLDICKADKKKIFFFEDPVDVSLIRTHRESEINTNFIAALIWHDGKEDNTYYITECDEQISAKKWELIFTKGFSHECCICLEPFGKGKSPDVLCSMCLATRCCSCAWKQHTPECPICREFDMDSYINKRLRCMYVIVTQAGLTKEIIQKKRTKQNKINACKLRINIAIIKEQKMEGIRSPNPDENMINKFIKKVIIKDEDIEDFIDFEMSRCGDNVYDVRDKIGYLKLIPTLIQMGDAWDWDMIHEVVEN